MSAGVEESNALVKVAARFPGHVAESMLPATTVTLVDGLSAELLNGLGELENWPDKVKLMQENWIGKSRGLQFRFRLAEATDGIDIVEVFTTRPDTIFGASFVAIAPTHPIAEAIAARDPKAAAAGARERFGHAAVGRLWTELYEEVVRERSRAASRDSTSR